MMGFMLLMAAVVVRCLVWAVSPRPLKRGGQVLLALVMVGLVGCGRSVGYSAEGFTYRNLGQDTAFGALDVERRTVTETLDPATGAVTERVTEETVVRVDGYEGEEVAARARAATVGTLLEAAARELELGSE
jgi:hypothetical protein